MPTTYEPIASQTLSSAAGIVTFSSIPQTYTDLVFIVNAKSTFAAYDISAIRINGIGSGYSKTYIESNGSGVSAGRGSAEISLRAGYLPGTNYTERSSDMYYFQNYTNTTDYKSVICRCNAVNTSVNFNVQTQISMVTTTNAITQITLQTANGSSLLAGSTFALYGIKAA